MLLDGRDNAVTTSKKALAPGSRSEGVKWPSAFREVLRILLLRLVFRVERLGVCGPAALLIRTGYLVRESLLQCSHVESSL